MEMPTLPLPALRKSSAVGTSETYLANEFFLKKAERWVPPKPLVDQHYESHKNARGDQMFALNFLSFSLKHLSTFGL